MNESIVEIGPDGRTGIITEPVKLNRDFPLILFLNAGIISNTGPNRLYLHLSRGFAQNGFASLRFDLADLGHLNVDHELTYEENHVNDILNIISVIEKNTGYNKFILLGLCSGGNLSIITASRDERIVGVIPINANLVPLEHNRSIINLARQKVKINYYKKNLFNLTRWLKIVSGESDFFREFPKLLKTRKNIKKNNTEKKPEPYHKNSFDDLIRLMKSRLCLMIFTKGDIFLEIYKIAMKKPLKKIFRDYGANTDVIILGNVDHTFTLQWSQNMLCDKICNYLRNKLN